MKLLFCAKCQDVVRLRVQQPRVCECRATGGQYKDDINAEIWGDGIPLGFSNHSFATALRRRPQHGMGWTFEAFVIPQECPTISVTPEAPQ